MEDDGEKHQIEDTFDIAREEKMTDPDMVRSFKKFKLNKESSFNYQITPPVTDRPSKLIINRANKNGEKERVNDNSYAKANQLLGSYKAKQAEASKQAKKTAEAINEQTKQAELNEQAKKIEEDIKQANQVKETIEVSEKKLRQ